jgi:MFS family permease
MPDVASAPRQTAELSARFRWCETNSDQRSTLMAASLGWMLDAFDVMLYSVVLTTLMREFAISKGTAGLLNSLTLVASAIGSFVFGILADRYGRRRMRSFSILTYSLFTFASGLTTTISALAGCRFLLGLGRGGEWNSGATLVAETWPSAWRGRAMGLVQSSWAVGYALAAVVANLVLARANWRWVFFYLRSWFSGFSTMCLSLSSGEARRREVWEVHRKYRLCGEPRFPVYPTAEADGPLCAIPKASSLLGASYLPQSSSR